MADRFQGVSERTVDLALAVNPVDARTGESLRDTATVSIDGVRAEPRLNPSGYWLFLNPPTELPSDPLSVTVEPPDGYVERTVEVRLADLDVPGTHVDVYPSTEYAFPPRTTLVEGTVERTVANGPTEPVAGATVTVADTDLETRTGGDGAFVLAVEDVATTESMANGDFVRVEPAQPSDPNAAPANPRPVEVYTQQEQLVTPTIEATHSQHGQASVQQELTEGERVALPSPLIL